MTYIHSLIISIILFIASIPLYGFFQNCIREYQGNTIAKPMDQAIEKEFTKPNQWNYTIEYILSDNERRLTYSLDPSLDVFDKQFTNHTKSIPFFIDIFHDFLERINSLREFRPFFAEFPLTPNCPL